MRERMAVVYFALRFIGDRIMCDGLEVEYRVGDGKYCFPTVAGESYEFTKQQN
jgi:hypothetical protein